MKDANKHVDNPNLGSAVADYFLRISLSSADIFDMLNQAAVVGSRESL